MKWVIVVCRYVLKTYVRTPPAHITNVFIEWVQRRVRYVMLWTYVNSIQHISYQLVLLILFLLSPRHALWINSTDNIFHPGCDIIYTFLFIKFHTKWYATSNIFYATLHMYRHTFILPYVLCIIHAINMDMDTHICVFRFSYFFVPFHLICLIPILISHISFIS